jgi:hypothetical protein
VKRQRRTVLLVFLLLLLGLAAGAAGLAQTSAGFNLEWHVLGSGGGESASASYRVVGTIGQGLASPPHGGNSGFSLSSGFWYSDQLRLYLPVITSN